MVIVTSPQSVAVQQTSCIVVSQSPPPALALNTGMVNNEVIIKQDEANLAKIFLLDLI
jgi:hypothetical protein